MVWIAEKLYIKWLLKYGGTTSQIRYEYFLNSSKLSRNGSLDFLHTNIDVVTIYLEGLTDMAASNWLTSMVENNP